MSKFTKSDIPEHVVEKLKAYSKGNWSVYFQDTEIKEVIADCLNYLDEVLDNTYKEDLVKIIKFIKKINVENDDDWFDKVRDSIRNPKLKGEIQVEFEESLNEYFFTPERYKIVKEDLLFKLKQWL